MARAQSRNLYGKLASKVLARTLRPLPAPGAPVWRGRPRHLRLGADPDRNLPNVPAELAGHGANTLDWPRRAVTRLNRQCRRCWNRGGWYRSACPRSLDGKRLIIRAKIYQTCASGTQGDAAGRFCCKNSNQRGDSNPSGTNSTFQPGPKISDESGLD